MTLALYQSLPLDWARGELATMSSSQKGPTVALVAGDLLFRLRGGRLPCLSSRPLAAPVFLAFKILISWRLGGEGLLLGFCHGAGREGALLARDSGGRKGKK